jgi:hypothetical protein
MSEKKAAAQVTTPKMLDIAIAVRGITPILMNPMTKEILDDLEGIAGTRRLKDTDSTPEQKAEKKIIRNEKDLIGIPAEYLFSCLVEAGRQIKIDTKRSMSTKDSSLVPSFLSIEDTFFPFKNQKAEWIVDRRRGVLDNGGKKVAVCITRPKFSEWEFDVRITLDSSECSEDKAKLLFAKAGKSVGLGDFRPSCRGNFGKFVITKWVAKEAVVEYDLAA